MDNEFILKVTLERIAGSGEPYEATTEYCSPSTLKKVKKSPLHYKEEEKTTSTALEFGKAYHCAILEPQEFKKRYWVPDTTSLIKKANETAAKQGKEYADITRTKIYKDLLAKDAEGREGEQLAGDDMATIIAMRDRLFEDPYARNLFRGGVAEQQHYCKLEAQDGHTYGVRFIPDYLKTKKRLCVDLKTAADASVDGFKRAAANYGYHIQAALSVDMLEHIYTPGLPWTFIFVAQETKPPYAYNIFRASAQFLGQGRYEYELLMMLWRECVEEDEYPGYQVWCENTYGINEIDLPPWAVKEVEFYKRK